MCTMLQIMRRAVGSNHIQYYPNAQLSRLPLSPSSITLRSYSTPGETRTRTPTAGDQDLNLTCLPFHHQSVVHLDTLMRFELTSPGFPGLYQFKLQGTLVEDSILYLSSTKRGDSILWLYLLGVRQPQPPIPLS